MGERAHLEGSRFGPHLSALTNFASALVRPKRAKTGGSRERLNVLQSCRSQCISPTELWINASRWRRSREPPAFVRTLVARVLRPNIIGSYTNAPKRLPSSHSAAYLIPRQAQTPLGDTRKRRNAHTPLLAPAHECASTNLFNASPVAAVGTTLANASASMASPSSIVVFKPR